MLRWLITTTEVRKRPVRVIASMMIIAFLVLGVGDFYGAGTHSFGTASAIGGGCAVMAGLLTARGLWPDYFARSMHTEARWVFARRIWLWHWPLVLLAISLALLGFGISAGSAGVAFSGLPFMVLAALFVLAHRLSRR